MGRSEPWPARWTPRRGDLARVRRVTRAEAIAGIDAPAKINLGLAVVGKRSDGYHKLVTLMTTISLADTVRVEPAATFSLVCDDPALDTDDNLALRAARSLATEIGGAPAARITLTKRIPAAAGLGGGSSDAAAALIALDGLWDVNLPDATLLRLGRALGADVPFLLYGGAMTARGIGDVLSPAVVPPTWLVLVVPRVAIPQKTAALYGALTPDDYGDGRDVQRQVAALRAGVPLDLSLLGNPFLAPLERLAPVVRRTREAIAATGAHAFLSGSGPALYVPCASESEAHSRAVALHQILDTEIIVTQTGRGSVWRFFARSVLSPQS